MRVVHSHSTGGRFLSILSAFIAIAAISNSCSRPGEVLKSYAIIADGQHTVFAQTQEKYKVEYDSLSMGIFVKSINGDAISKSAYWIYFVNSSAVSKAADVFIPLPGDTIEWRLISGY
jgi:hypothetical protein